jgi:mannosyltransferase OCH1-like enzyme
MCHTFLQDVYGERHANAYKVLVPGAYRADFWRYCMLYKFGGVYADAKTTVLRPLDEILRPDDELVLVRDLPETCILNGFIACSPRHPLLGLVIDMVLDRIEARSYGDDPLDITGPHIFARAFCRWKGYQENTMALFSGYTRTIQMLARHEDKKHIISPEGERIFMKEYDTYYKNDMDVTVHYPQLWAYNAVYVDQPPYVNT